MQYSKISLLALSALIRSVLADSQPFGVLTSHSSSKVHLLPFYDAGNGLLVGSPTSSDQQVGFTITDKGTLRFSNGKYATVNAEGVLNDGDEADAVTGWAIEKGVVTLNGGKEYYAVATENPLEYRVSVKDVEGSVFFYMIGTTGDNNQQYTFVPAGSDDVVSASQATTSTQTTSTLAPVSTAVVTSTTSSTTTASSVSSTSTSLTPLITVSEQSENGANHMDLGLSMGLGAIAALLL